MALTLEECDRMIDAAERAGVALIVGNTASFNPGVQTRRGPTEGCYAALLTFKEGAVATLVYSGYDHLNSADLASGHLPRDPQRYGAARRALGGVQTPEEEATLRVASGYSAGVPPTSASLLQQEPSYSLPPGPVGPRCMMDAGRRPRWRFAWPC